MMEKNDTPSGPKAYDEILDAARSADYDDLMTVEAVLIDAAKLDALRRDAVLRALKSATGIGLGALRKAAYDLTGEVM